MKINKDFTVQQVGGAYVAVPVGESSRSFHGMIRLNETGALLWKCMAEKDCTEEDLVKEILARYEIDRETAEKDVHRIVSVLAEHKVILE